VKRLARKLIVPIDSLKETSWSTILLFSVLYCVYVTFINLVVFKSNILHPISKLTLGLINGTLTVNIVSVLIFVFIIILKCGRLSLFDIGIKKNRLLSAIAAIFILWIFIQLLNIIVGLIISGNPIINDGWSKYGALKMFGSIIGQLFGNALFEEIAFRGFLLVQICKKLRGTKGELFTGLAVSQLLFALIHIPNRILGGMSIFEILPSLIIVFILGLLFATVYLITDNIFLSIGIHALWNTPLLVFDGLPSMLVILIATIILLIIWDRTFGKFSSNSNNPSNNLMT
jgi:hypothetical protein